MGGNYADMHPMTRSTRQFEIDVLTIAEKAVAEVGVIGKLIIHLITSDRNRIPRCFAFL